MKFKVTLSILIITLLSCNNAVDEKPDEPFIPTDPSTEFNLYELFYFIPNLPETYELKGSDSNGNIIECTIVNDAQRIMTYNGLPADPVKSVVSMTNKTNNATVTAITTTYYYYPMSGGFYSLGFIVNGNIYNPCVGNKMEIARNARIGDRGSLGQYIDSAGNRTVSGWKLTDAGNEHAYIYELSSAYDSNNNLVTETEIITKINTSGKKLHINMKIYYPTTEVTVTLNSIN